MKVGTKSLLFGVHQVFIHPLFVLISWFKLYGRPTWRELVCIIIHDWGYFGCPNMDGHEGKRHPEKGAMIALKLFGPDYHDLVLYHSRHYSRANGVEPSKLCWADKLSIQYEPWWLYLPRAWASGELFEYRLLAAGLNTSKLKIGFCFVPMSASHCEWYRWVQDRLIKLGTEQRGDAVPYINPSTKIKEQS